MKKHLRIFAVVLAAAMSLAVFAACDEDAEGTSSPASANSSSTQTSSLPTIETSSMDPVSDPAAETSSETVSETSSETASDPVSEPAGETSDEPEAEPLPDTVELISLGAEFQCLPMDTADFQTYIDTNPTWKDADYDVSEWQTANAPLGDRVNGTSPIGWGVADAEPHGLLAVTTFEIEDIDAYEGRSYSMNIFYDNTIYMYLNGNLIFSDDTATTGANDWVDAYTDIQFTEDIGQYLVEGTNTLSISLLDGWGGRELDMALISKK